MATEEATEEAVVYGFYDGDYGPDYGIIWYCFGLPFTSVEMAQHTGSKSTWGTPVIVERPAGSTDPKEYELVEEERV